LLGGISLKRPLALALVRDERQIELEVDLRGAR